MIAEPRVDIVIPTFNRAAHAVLAVEASLAQSYPHRRVVVIDDGSTDDTRARLAPFFDRPDFCYIQLASNLGTAQAKNVALALLSADAVTFHDSDDRPHPDKVLRQARIVSRTDIRADSCLNWALIGKAPGDALGVGAVFTHHELLMPDGRRVAIHRDLSLVDDVFPNLQMGAGVPGDWTHVNSGLFDTRVFARLGGFRDCIEEDREFRNRLIFAGEVIWVIPDILLTKIETPQALTQAAETDYNSARRTADRRLVWVRAEAWRRGEDIAPDPIDLPDLSLRFVSDPAALAASDALMTPATRTRIDAIRAEVCDRPTTLGDGGKGDETAHATGRRKVGGLSAAGREATGEETFAAEVAALASRSGAGQADVVAPASAVPTAAIPRSGGRQEAGGARVETATDAGSAAVDAPIDAVRDLGSRGDDERADTPHDNASARPRPVPVR